MKATTKENGQMHLDDAYTMAINLMDKHGLLDKYWRFQYSWAKVRFGYCSHSQKVIKLSRPMTQVNDEAEVKDTILHEIAHALLGPGHGHDQVWRQKALEIGCNGQARWKTEVVQEPAKRWKATCPTCGYVAERHRLRGKTRRQACYFCCTLHNGGKFDDRFLMTWTRNF